MQAWWIAYNAQISNSQNTSCGETFAAAWDWAFDTTNNLKYPSRPKCPPRSKLESISARIWYPGSVANLDIDKRQFLATNKPFSNV